MIRSLRRKFILIAMVSVLGVLALLMTVVNIVNYQNINDDLDDRISMIEESGGDLGGPGAERDFGGPKGDAPKDIEDFGDRFQKKRRFPGGTLSEESPFDTRFFTVTFDGDGNVTDTDVSNIASIDEDEAVEIATEYYKKEKWSGFHGEFKFLASEKDGERMFIFLNASRELATFKFFLYASVGVSLLGALLVFLLVVIFSGIALKPVAESYEKQKRFITDASHDIKTPLAIIDANTEVIEMESGESEWTKSIRNQIARLKSLVEKLVFLSRMDEEGSKITPVEFDIAEAARGICESYEAAAIAAKKEIALDTEETLLFSGDESMILQMFSLLLDNALKYASEGTQIMLSVKPYRRGRRGVRIVLENEAEDLEAKSYDFLFDRFTRADASRTSSTGGHGIGLSVVAAIASAHRGRAAARSEDGKTIEFIIILQGA